jgi:hypothetical protein
MAYSMTYSSLLVDLRSYLERGFTEASDPLVFQQLPKLITLAERRLATELKIQGFIRAVSAPTTAGTAVYEKPDGWRDTVSVFIDNHPVFARSLEYCKNYWPDSSETGDPEFYADYDYAHYLITPTPSSAKTMEIVYYGQPPLLGETVQTNWLTDYAPNALLYAALLEATPYLKQDSRVATWQQYYDRAASSLNGQDLLKILDRAAQRTEA